MNKLLTIILIVVSTSVVAQRPGNDFKSILDGGKPAEDIYTKKDGKDWFLLYPGNWENSEEAATYFWAEDNVSEGYIFGTNNYGDKAYGQIFETDHSYIIYGAYYWIGERYGEEGVVSFNVWNYTHGSVGDLLGSKSYQMADIEASEYIDEAFWVEFDPPVFVDSDFLIGADISDLNPFEEEVYGIGNVSSMDGDGAGAGLALILEGQSWRPVLDFDMDVDIAIFPLVDYATLRNVTFNVDMADAFAEGDVEFDANKHDVYISASFLSWTKPGDNPAYMLQPANNEKEGLVYTITFDDIYTGFHRYKYYIVENEPSWDMAEYPEDEQDRFLILREDQVVNDVFGSVYEANIFDFWFLKKNVHDEWVDADVVDRVDIEHIDESRGRISVYVEYGTNISGLTPTMTINYQATIDPIPAIGDFEDFGAQGAKTYRVMSVDDEVTKSWTINIFESDEVSVQEPVMAGQKLLLYPNPVRNVLTVENSDVINSVRIFDITGRMIYAKDVNDNQTRINVNDLHHGVYIIQVITDRGIQSRKIQVVK